MINIQQSSNLNNGLAPAVEFSFSEKLTVSERDVCVSIFKNLAVSIRQQHPELSFDRLLLVIVSDDVWETVSELEKTTGRELQAARNGAESHLVFAVDLGHFDVLVYRIELINGFSNGHPSKTDSVWYYLNTLASIHYFTVVNAMFTDDPRCKKANHAELSIFSIASHLLAKYWAGYFSFHTHNSPVTPFDDLAETMAHESKQIETAFTMNVKHADESRLFSELHSSAASVCQSMATAMGYCDAANQSLAEISPKTWASMLYWNFEEVWLKMAPDIRMVFSGRYKWKSAIELLPAVGVLNYFVHRYGLTFTSDGGTTPFRSVALERKNTH